MKLRRTTKREYKQREIIVVVHEMVHLSERLHNDRFVHFMDHYLPT
ncbi:YgjP-like metallopeptidase domain-containing protein [Spirosoma koreense]